MNNARNYDKNLRYYSEKQLDSNALPKMTVVKNFQDYVNNNWQKTITLAQRHQSCMFTFFLTIKIYL